VLVVERESQLVAALETVAVNGRPATEAATLRF
jgi:hypothetical protein